MKRGTIPFVAQEGLLVIFLRLKHYPQDISKTKCRVIMLVTGCASVGEAPGLNKPSHIFTLQSYSQRGGYFLEITENLGRNTFCVASEPHISGRDHKSICF